ncbi:MAG: class I SAM-dependent methyltransferase [Anaerolineae bacterium]|nr:class I SAM-dependent methyltransferase [Anaerolineae bacterium]
MPPGARVLDVGAGRMSLAEAALQAAGYRAGVDLMATDLRQNARLHGAAQANANALPFPAGSFALVINQWVVEHFAQPEAAFAEMGRVLAPGGRMVFFTTNAQNYVPWLARLVPDGLRGWILRRLLRRPEHESFPTYYRANTRQAIAALAAAQGLELEKLEFIGNPFYLAFSVPLFRLALGFERWSDAPARQHLKLYLVASLRKPG